ncbi:MAG: TonB-dependent receptor [Roseivirga sp.]
MEENTQTDRMFLLRRLLLLLLLMQQGITLYGQGQTFTLKGTVKDGETGEDLIGASVYIIETQGGAISNPYGFYSVVLPEGSYTLKISYIGYATVVKKVELQTDLSLNVELLPETSQLEEVTVYAEAEDSNVKDTKMSVARIDATTIKQLPTVFGEADVIKSIQLLPGVSSAGETSGGFNVRGGSADQNLILLDEATIFNTSHLFGLVSVFNADAIKDVTLYKGGIPASYGGRLSSVLDVRQKEGNSKEFGGSAGIGLVSSRLNLEGPLDGGKGSFLLAGRRSYVDLFLPAILDDPPTVFFYDVNLKANYAFNDNNRLFISGYFGRDNFSVDNFLNNDWGNLAFNLRYNRVINNKLFSNFSFIYSDYRYNFDIERSDGYAWEAHIENFNFKSDFSLFLEGENQLDFGANLLYYDFNPGQISPNEESSTVPTTLDAKFAFEPAAYVNFKKKLSARATLEAGMRFSSFFRMGQEEISLYENDQPVLYNASLGRYEKGRVIGTERFDTGESISSFFNLEPRLMLNYQLNSNSSFKVSYNRTAQYIHLISNSTSPTALNIWTPSGPYTDPQIADQLALGYFRNFKDNTFETSVEAFYKDMQNQVDYVDGADIQLNNNLETELLSGQGRAYGLELYVRKKRGRFTGWLSYTLSRSERRVSGVTDEDPGINLGEYYPSNFDKTHDLSVSTFYKLTDRVSLSANFIYQTGMPTTYPASRYEFGGLVGANFEGRNQQRLPDNHRLDVSLTLKAKKKRKWDSSWVFSLYNLYNNRNAYDVNFAPVNAQRGAEISDFFIRKYDTEANQSYIGLFPNITYNIKF